MNICVRKVIFIQGLRYQYNFCSDTQSVASQKQTSNQGSQKFQQTPIQELEKLQKYYSIKYIHKDEWIQGNWLQVYLIRDLNKYEQAQRRNKVLRSFLPSIIFGAYWAMIGPFDYFHIAIAGLLGVQILRSSLIRIFQHSSTLEALYLHKNGYEWAMQLPKNFTESQDILEEYFSKESKSEIEDLRQTLQTPKSSILYKFSIWKLQQTCKNKSEEAINEIKQFSDLEQQQFESQIKIHPNHDFKRELQYDLTMNAKPEFNDFFKPFINKQRVIFAFKNNELRQKQNTTEDDSQKQ